MKPRTRSDPGRRPITSPWPARVGFAAAVLLTGVLAFSLYRSLLRSDEARRAEASRETAAERDARIESLLEAGQVAEARREWIASNAPEGLVDEDFEMRRNELWNGDFELPLEGGAFGWRVPESGNVTAKRTISVERDGRVLRIAVEGDGEDLCGLHQRVAVDPGARYLLSFSARSEELVAGGGIVLEAVDAGGEVLYRSLPIRGTMAWQGFLGSLEVPASSSAVVVRTCSAPGLDGAGPATGRLWLDSLVLEKVAGGPPGGAQRQVSTSSR